MSELNDFIINMYVLVPVNRHRSLKGNAQVNCLNKNGEMIF
jgi:hypothetical protein